MSPIAQSRSVTTGAGVSKEQYPDFGPTLAAEMLAEHHGLKVSRETVRKWMQEDGIWLPHKRDIRQCTEHDMKVICDRLNNTPRKRLGWKTPAEVYREKILEEMR